jgi:hypothetical protein
MFVETLSGSPWSHYRLAGAKRTAEVYLIKDDHPKPVVVMLQGSGCAPLFTVNADQTFHGTSIFDDVVASRTSRFHFALVEKQGVTPLQFAPGMTPQQKLSLFKKVQDGACSPAYFKNETAVIRTEDALDVVRALSTEPWVRGVLVTGHSEGSHVVTGVLRHDTDHLIAAAALFSSAGPTQFYTGAETRESFGKTFEMMQKVRQADDDAMFEDHAARRWKSYALDTTPLEDVRQSVVPLYVAHGEREANIHAADLFVLEALRQQPSRPLRYVVVGNGNHAFVDATGRDHFAQVFDDFASWALGAGHLTGFTVIK